MLRHWAAIVAGDAFCSVADVMAYAAVGRGVPEFVTVGTGNHRDILFLPEQVLGGDGSVAYLAIDSCTAVLLMAEGHEAWQSVLASP